MISSSSWMAKLQASYCSQILFHRKDMTVWDWIIRTIRRGLACQVLQPWCFWIPFIFFLSVLFWNKVLGLAVAQAGLEFIVLPYLAPGSGVTCVTIMPGFSDFVFLSPWGCFHENDSEFLHSPAGKECFLESLLEGTFTLSKHTFFHHPPPFPGRAQDRAN